MKFPMFYLCSCASPAESGGIYLLQKQNLQWNVRDFELLEGTNYLAVAPNRQTLYATINRPGRNGGAAAYHIEADGTLTFLNEISEADADSCHLTVSPSGKALFCANYSSGSIHEYRLHSDGSFTGASRRWQHQGKLGPRSDRQEMSHPHCTVVTPDGTHLVVADLGLDVLALYPLNAEGTIAGEAKYLNCEPGSGPRHILFSGDGNYGYLLNELGNSVTTFRYEKAGKLTPLHTVSTLPETWNHEAQSTKAAAIRFSPDEHFLLASNRGLDSIAVFDLRESRDLPKLLSVVNVHGESPRDFAFLPDGKTVCATNENSDTMTFFSFEPSTGALEFLSDETNYRFRRPIALFPF